MTFDVTTRLIPGVFTHRELAGLLGEISFCTYRTETKTLFWYFGTWKVQSLLDSEGSAHVETACQSQDCRQVTEDKQINLVVGKLDGYKIPVAALHETNGLGKLCTVWGRVL